MAEAEEQRLRGGCLCGRVRYEVVGAPLVFHYCHCSRCRKSTGSAHASNLFFAPEKLRWLEGQEAVKRFEPEGTKYFATAFCEQCGSSLPWAAKGGRTMVVPAGTLEEPVSARPQQAVFWGSRADWYVDPASLPRHEALPPRRKGS